MSSIYISKIPSIFATSLFLEHRKINIGPQYRQLSDLQNHNCFNLENIGHKSAMTLIILHINNWRLRCTITIMYFQLTSNGFFLTATELFYNDYLSMHLLINIPDRTGVSVNSETKHFVKYNLVFLRWAAKSPTQLVTTTSLLQLLQAVPFQLPIMQEHLERNKNTVTMNMCDY